MSEEKTEVTEEEVSYTVTFELLDEEGLSTDAVVQIGLFNWPTADELANLESEIIDNLVEGSNSEPLSKAKTAKFLSIQEAPPTPTKDEDEVQHRVQFVEALANDVEACRKFAKAFIAAVEEESMSFEFKGTGFDTRYAMYLLEHLTQNLKVHEREPSYTNKVPSWVLQVRKASEKLNSDKQQAAFEKGKSNDE